MGGSVDENASESAKPVQITYPDPTDDDFDDDIGEEEREHYREKFKDLNDIKNFKPHCSACDRHLGCSTYNDTKMRVHPMLRTLVCSTCHSFYNSGEFDKGEDGSELYCRWCGQGGQVYCCSDCPVVFCAKCIRRNLGNPKIKEIENLDDWKCFKCNPKPLWDLRAVCWALLRYVDLKIKITHKTTDPELKERYTKDCLVDHSECCKDKKKRSSLPRRKEETKKSDVKIEGLKKTDIKIEPPKKPDNKIDTPVKLPPSIQVKKFAAINVEEPKKAQKRPASPKNKLTYVTKPISIAPRMPLNVLTQSYSGFPKRPKVGDDSLASTSSTPGSPQTDEITRWFNRPKGKQLDTQEKEWIFRVFKKMFEKKLQEIRKKNSHEVYNSDIECQRACVKTISKDLGLSKYLICKIVRDNGMLVEDEAGQQNFDQLRPKLIPNPYNKERNMFMPLVPSQYVARKPPPPLSMSTPYPSPRMAQRPMYNGYPTMPADNINLSLENLTQGLDVNAMLAGRSARPRADDSELVCTPDFPLEPLCEVTEENNDDDVECMTPGPVALPKPSGTSGPKRSNRPIDTDNIIQMTEMDVTVNAVTGGLKFRVDPQTLSANKMYRLPDGRVFAINANSKMPGGYSATIVALADDGNKQSQPARGTTYSAKVSAVSKSTSSKPQEKRSTSVIKKTNKALEKGARSSNPVDNGQTKGRKCDLNVPVEWYIYNVTDAVDSLEYTLSRLKKLKKNTNTTFLRTRSVEEISTLHKNLDRLLTNSATRFSEIRVSLGKGYRSYCQRKASSGLGDLSDSDADEDDDDDVEILADNHDEPIFIDENSVDSNSVLAEGQVDLVSSDLNDSGEKDKSAQNIKEASINNQETDLNGKINHSEEAISISNEVAKNGEADPVVESGDRDGDDTSKVNTIQNEEMPSKHSQQKAVAEAMEINDETDNLVNNDISGDEAEINDVDGKNDAVGTNNEDNGIMETRESFKEYEKEEDKNDEEEKNNSGNCDSTNEENNCNADNSVAGDDKDENETETSKKDCDDNVANNDEKDKSESDKGDNDKEVSDKDDIVKDNEVDLLNDSQDIEKLDDDDIESLLKGGDEFEDLASKVQCIVDMDPDLI